MRSIRLLPVVIFAALALLVFKGIGLVTNGGYVLTGATEVAAATEGEAASADNPTLELAGSSEATMTDDAPTLDDKAPTILTKEEGEGSSSEAPSSAAGAEQAAAGEASSSQGQDTASAQGAASGEVPSPAAEASADNCSNAAPVTSSSAEGETSSRVGDAPAAGCPPPATPVNENGDALPTIKNAKGQTIPLQIAEGENSAPALVDRLSERRAELDKREADLEMRAALVEAAEKRMNDRAKELADLEAQVKALVDQKQAAEDAGFKAVVSMYETMKPKEAAAIFNTLDLAVLSRIARAMSPRKMSAILALMNTQQAEALTTDFATEGPTGTVADAGRTADLPQILGQ